MNYWYLCLTRHHRPTDWTCTRFNTLEEANLYNTIHKNDALQTAFVQIPKWTPNWLLTTAIGLNFDGVSIKVEN